MEEPLQKRQRVSLACQSCRDRKIRCDGARPACTACQRGKRRLRLPCVYLPTVMGLQTADKSVQSMADRLQELEEELVTTASLRRKRAFPQQLNSKSSIKSHDGSHEDGIEQAERGQGRISDSPILSPSRSFLTGNIKGPASLNPKTGCEESNPRASSAPDDAVFYSSISTVQNCTDDSFGPFPSEEFDRPEEDTQYYGESTSTSFIKEMNKTFLSKVGPDVDLSASALVAHQGLFGVIKACGNNFRDVSRAGHNNSRLLVENMVLPSRSLCDHLLERYWKNIYPLFHFIHKPTFNDAYEMLWATSADQSRLTNDTNAGLGNKHDAGPQTEVFYCALNVMMALGVHSSDIPVGSRQRAMAAFMRRSSSLLLVDMMDRGTVALLQTLLLTAHFYHSYPQKCWNLIGVAGRIAQGLGLHVDKSSSKISRLGKEMRRRVWYGCMLMDTGVSMALGRPAMQDYCVPLPEAIDDDYLTAERSASQPQGRISIAAFFVESMKLNNILAHILRTIYEPEYFGAEIAQLPTIVSPDSESLMEMEAILKLEAKLSKFHREIPGALRWDRKGDDVRASMPHIPYYLEPQRNMLHVRYLHIQTILYRKMFVKLCQNSRLGAKSRMNQHVMGDEELTAHSFFASRCSVICVKMAMEIISLVHKSLRTEAQDTWWYNMLSRTCNFLDREVDTESLEKSLELCEETLADMTVHGDGPRRCLDSIKMMRKRVLTEITSHQADPMRSTSATQNQSSREDGTAGYLEKNTVDSFPSFDMEDWRDVVAENSLWTIDLGDWWENPAVHFPE